MGPCVRVVEAVSSSADRVGRRPRLAAAMRALHRPAPNRPAADAAPAAPAAPARWARLVTPIHSTACP